VTHSHTGPARLLQPGL